MGETVAYVMRGMHSDIRELDADNQARFVNVGRGVVGKLLGELGMEPELLCNGGANYFTGEVVGTA